MKYRKNQVIENTCHLCYNPKMKIYRVTRAKDSNEVLIWCECEKCGAIDDIIRDEN